MSKEQKSREADRRQAECVCGNNQEIKMTGTSGGVSVSYSGDCDNCGRGLVLLVQVGEPE